MDRCFKGFSVSGNVNAAVIEAVRDCGVLILEESYDYGHV